MNPIMWRSITILALLALAADPARAGDTPPPAAPGPAMTADAILDEVTGRLPRAPLQITGELKADPRDGKPARRCQVQLRLDYGATPSQARYTIMDSFGEDLEQVEILRQKDGRCTWHYARGYPLAGAPLPDPKQTIQGTDLTWSDISLSFLWWRHASISGTEKVLDRDCYIIEAPAPAGEKTPYSLARLWIDRQYLMLLRAEGCDANGKTLRRVAVKSIKKINDEWMVKDLDVTSLPSNLRTSLRINIVDKPQTESPAR